MVAAMERNSFRTKVRRAVARRKMIKPGELVLVACSGGADSVALLHVLIELREEMGFNLALAHFHHGLRKSADADAALVRELAKHRGIPFFGGKRNVRAFARRRGLNLEESGRMLRYDFLKKTAARVGASKIATGHTLDDQAETVLIRLFRGSGPRGLGGIAPVSEEGIIRPLLEVRRREIEVYLGREKIAFRTDETNLDRRFLRNRIRHDLLPHLEKRFDPEIIPKLGRLADILREEDALLETFVNRKAARLLDRAGGRIRLNVARLSRLPAGLARRLIRAFIEAAKGDLRRISFDHVEILLKLKEGQVAVLPGGLAVVREGGWIIRSADRPKRSAAQRTFSHSWDGRTELVIPETGGRFVGRFIRGSKLKRPGYDDSRRCYLDAGCLEFPLAVRGRREGDRYRPLGAPGRKKLKEIFRQKSVPRSERGRRAVFLSGGDIVWVEGLPVAEAFKVTPRTGRIFLIERGRSGARSRRRGEPRAGGCNFLFRRCGRPSSAGWARH
jgi:tRNA(Ile)-lysidine synthase